MTRPGPGGEARPWIITSSTFFQIFSQKLQQNYRFRSSASCSWFSGIKLRSGAALLQYSTIDWRHWSRSRQTVIVMVRWLWMVARSRFIIDCFTDNYNECFIPCDNGSEEFAADYATTWMNTDFCSTVWKIGKIIWFIFILYIFMRIEIHLEFYDKTSVFSGFYRISRTTVSRLCFNQQARVQIYD